MEGSEGVQIGLVEGLVIAFTAIPAALSVWNLLLYRRPHIAGREVRLGVSVLIPARNEERSIEACVRSVLRSRNLDLEVVVVDDHSEDRTAAIVRRLAQSDARIKLIASPPLPDEWCGKQHACHIAAKHAKKAVLCFLDADVRVAPDCVASLAADLLRGRTALLSGLPYQETESFAERLLIPLIHFVLLGFLPMFFMRRSTDPSYSAGCGQIFVADAAAYRKAGGHAAIRSSRHDGITLPRAFRRAGFATDLCDLTRLASCRMYHNSAEVFSGLSKNATEGLAAPARIVPFTLLLGIGQVAPVVVLALKPGPVAAVMVALMYLPRFLTALRFRQSWLGAVCHPLAVAILLAIQWNALVRSVRGVPSTWKGRPYSPGATP